MSIEADAITFALSPLLPLLSPCPRTLQQDNREDFEPFLFTLDDEEGRGAPTMDDFCAHQVEAIGKEADHVQIAALSSCLKVS